MRLKELRINDNKKPEDLAKILCISLQAYYKYENNKNEPNIENLCKLADYYKVSLDYLVGRNFTNEIGYLNAEQKTAVKLIQNLNTTNLNHAIAFMQGLYVNQ